MLKPVQKTNPTLAHQHGSTRDRYDAGRAQRELVPLAAQSEVPTDADRTDPLAILQAQDTARLPEIVPLRYGRMSRTPFTFLRGAAAVMASDLAAQPRTDLWVELCGDAHLGNFRWYNAPDRRAVFDLNDFDETLPGPFEWDVKRLAASIVVSGRNRGFSPEKCRAAAQAAMRDYRMFIAEASKLSPLDLHYYRFELDAVLERIEKRGKKHRKWKEEIASKAARKTSMRALDRLTDIVEGRRVIVPDPPRVLRMDERLAAGKYGGVEGFLNRYRKTLPLDRRILFDRFSLVDVAKKVVGVGSVGTRCVIALLESDDRTPLFLQAKQAVPSVLEPHLGASAFKQSGQRVVEGQRLIQATSDIFLGWATWTPRKGEKVDFYVRQLWDGKGKVDVEALSPKRLAAFAGLCGKTLAFAHARSGDAMTIRGYIGEDDEFENVMVDYAERYADLTDRDHARLTAAIADGAVEVDLEEN